MKKRPTNNLRCQSLETRNNPVFNREPEAGSRLPGEFANQTFVHGIKTRDIIKNNYFMPKIRNPAFIPASKRLSKENIARAITHNPELDYLDAMGPKFESRFASKKESFVNGSAQPSLEASDRKPGDVTKLGAAGVSDSAFGKKLEGIEKNLESKLSLNKMIYSNDFVNRNKTKVSVYDY